MEYSSASLQEAVTSLVAVYNLCLETKFGRKDKFFVKFIYEEELDACLMLSICDEGIHNEILQDYDNSTLTQKKLTGLQGMHDRLFGDGVNENEWKMLYNVFIFPVLNALPEGFGGYIFTIFDSSFFLEKSSFFNIAHLYNLYFLFAETEPGDNEICFVNISDEPQRFIKKLTTAPRPLVKDLDIIYSYPKQYKQEALEADPLNEDLLRRKAREEAFIQGLAAARSSGARVYTPTGIGIFEEVFDKGCKGRVIQLLSHFHDGKIYMPNLKAFVQVTTLCKLLDKMRSENRLRDDISLHAVTCTNFDDFQPLFKKGIKNIYYSSNDLNLNTIAGSFMELYTGHNAKIAGFDYPYLDGESFIFEAWEKVFRCFCKLNYN